MGHGHVIKNQDGSKARCGGPAICAECAIELSSIKQDGNIHTMPHKESGDCWCEPELKDDFTAQGGIKHYVHRDRQ